METKIKQVIVVRKDLNMRKGKIAAQSAHASMKVILDLMETTHSTNSDLAQFSLELSTISPIYQWLTGSFAKVVVSVDSEEELLSIYRQAQDSLIPCAIIQDSGKTEFHGIPTYTAVAIGPYYSEQIDQITGQLKLL